MLQGKGYPDVCTRQLLCRLCSELRLTALALVDADPHGFEIFFTYKYGSLVSPYILFSYKRHERRIVALRILKLNSYSLDSYEHKL